MSSNKSKAGVIFLVEVLSTLQLVTVYELWSLAKGCQSIRVPRGSRRLITVQTSLIDKM